MLAVNYSTVRENLKTYCDKVIAEAEVVIITRKDNQNAVLMSLAEYNETQRQLKNALYLKDLQESITQLRDGKIITKTNEELGIKLK